MHTHRTTAGHDINTTCGGTGMGGHLTAPCTTLGGSKWSLLPHTQVLAQMFEKPRQQRHSLDNVVRNITHSGSNTYTQYFPRGPHSLAGGASQHCGSTGAPTGIGRAISWELYRYTGTYTHTPHMCKGRLVSQPQSLLQPPLGTARQLRRLCAAHA